VAWLQKSLVKESLFLPSIVKKASCGVTQKNPLGGGGFFGRLRWVLYSGVCNQRTIGLIGSKSFLTEGLNGFASGFILLFVCFIFSFFCCFVLGTSFKEGTPRKLSYSSSLFALSLIFNQFVLYSVYFFLEFQGVARRYTRCYTQVFITTRAPVYVIRIKLPTL